MATPFQAIYNSFLQKVKNYAFITMTQTDVNSLLSGYLQSGIPRFQYQCVNDLTQQDSTLQQFNVDLFSDEIEILSTCMLFEYLKSKVYIDELLKQGFTNREWSRTSQANHLDQMMKLKDDTDKDIDKMIIRYTYNHADLSELQ